MSGLYRFLRFSTPLHHVEILKSLHRFRVVERWWKGGGDVENFSVSVNIDQKPWI